MTPGSKVLRKAVTDARQMQQHTRDGVSEWLRAESSLGSLRA